MQPDPMREWREQYARRCLRVDFEPLPGPTFHASLKPIFSELRIVRAALSPGFLFRDEDLLRDDDYRIGFVVAQSGELTARHLGREIRLAPGDATMMLMSATGGIGWRDSSVLFDMLIPPAELEARGARTGDVLMQRLWGKSDAMQLLRGYIRSLERTGLTAFGDHHTIIHRHIIDLMVLATTSHLSVGESSLSAVAAARLHAIFDHLASHFSDPELNLSKVAQNMGISTRYLQRLLETSGTSFAAHVTELRLKHAYTLLTAQGKSDVRIVDVALQTGFSDISHFNRLFRSRFSDTPGGVRAEGKKDVDASSRSDDRQSVCPIERGSRASNGGYSPAHVDAPSRARR
jgi:AraC-like DNA-binding protein